MAVALLIVGIIAEIKPLHKIRQFALHGEPDDKVHVVVHKAIMKNINPGVLFEVQKKAKVVELVSLRMENVLLIIAAADDVECAIGGDESIGSRHACLSNSRTA
jgi:hypothetical protein